MGPRTDMRPDHPGGVDLYVGGVEHAVLHLLYARFWHKVLFDLGYLSSSEPYARLFNQGYVLAAAYDDERGIYVTADEVVDRRRRQRHVRGPAGHPPVGQDGQEPEERCRPSEIYDAYGADTLRLHLMATGPLDASRPWETRDVVGMFRFLQRLWRNIVDEQTGEVARRRHARPTTDTTRLLHRTIDAVRADMEALRFNTAIAKLIELNNHVTKLGATPREVAEALVLMIVAARAPRRRGAVAAPRPRRHPAYEPMPEADPALLVDDTVEYPVQVNGKVRSHITVAADADAATVEAAALADPKVQAALAGADPKKVIVVPGRMVNVVV